MEKMVINLIFDFGLEKLVDSEITLDLYQFGSSVEHTTYRDIDLLIVYRDCDKTKQSCILALKKEIINYLSRKYQTDIDITILSESEERELDFLNKINYLKIF